MTLSRALAVGILGMMVPSLALFLVPLILVELGPTPMIREIAAWLIPVGFGLAWLVWSLFAPRWRLWALKTVTDATGTEVRNAAVKAGLLWPVGHAWERTEIRGRNYPRREAQAELLGLLRQARDLAVAANDDDWGSGIYVRLVSYIEAAQAAALSASPDRAWASNLAAEILLHARNGSLDLGPRADAIFGEVLTLLDRDRTPAAT